MFERMGWVEWGILGGLAVLALSSQHSEPSEMIVSGEEPPTGMQPDDATARTDATYYSDPSSYDVGSPGMSGIFDWFYPNNNRPGYGVPANAQLRFRMWGWQSTPIYNASTRAMFLRSNLQRQGFRNVTVQDTGRAVTAYFRTSQRFNNISDIQGYALAAARGAGYPQRSSGYGSRDFYVSWDVSRVS